MKKQTLSRSLSLLFVISILLISVLVSYTSCAKGGSALDAIYQDSAPSASDSNGGIGNLPSGGVDNPNAKIIKTASANIRTLTYDNFIEKTYLKITELGGYTDSESFSGSAPYRYAYIVVRIPADKLDSFKEELSALGTLTSYTADKQDVTLTYSTLKAKVDTLTLEAAAVEELFEIAKASGNLSEISSLQTKLYDLRLEINQATAQLNAYDNSIAYSTVKLTVNETKEYIPQPEPEKKGAFKRIGENLKENLTDIAHFFVEFFVWFVSAIPYLIIFGIIGSGIVFVIISLKRKAKNKRNVEEDEKTSASETTDDKKTNEN